MLNLKGICVAFFILGLFSTVIVNAEEFDLQKGQDLVKGILTSIHRVLQDGVSNDAAIDATRSLEDLIYKANGLLTQNQRGSLKSMSTAVRTKLRGELSTYQDSFFALLKASGNEEENTIPLIYLLSEIHGN